MLTKKYLKYKDYHKKYYQEHKKERQKYQRIYNQKHNEELKQYQRQYYQSSNGKKLRIKHQTKRERDLNCFLMFENPFDKSEQIEYHHINDAYIVALPKDLHRQYMGKFHRENTMEIVKQIYLGDE